MMYIYAILSLALSWPYVNGDETIVFNDLEGVKIPKPISDMTATSGLDMIWVAGGCDNSQGNIFSQEGYFICPSVSDTLYSFDPRTNMFAKKASMPRPRYRHGAGFAKGRLFLFGGRALDDSLIPEVDMYDPLTDQWETVGKIPVAYLSSDQGSIAHDNGVYSFGGYDPEYNALGLSFYFDAEVARDEKIIKVTSLPEMQSHRGDVSAALVNGIVYVSGGFTHTNNYCKPFAVVERIVLATETWETVAPLATGRADQALVVLSDERLFALGGETQIENKCIIDPEDLPEVGEQTVAVDDVEVYDSSTNTWTVLASLPAHRFRFAAAGFQDSVYTFGGQLAYNHSCTCFRTSDSVVVYIDKKNDETSAGTGHSPWLVIGLSLALVVGAIW
mmetsp:Transcript_37063/g.56946  ORF Transcript_37063/g.56946 Transcript_37063/m.56946 type:complete len:389 (+) Transcript_37063:155-1321(+)